MACLANVDESKIVEVHGEDVPLLVEQFWGRGKKAIGLTGEDLYREHSIEERAASLKVLKRVAWSDPAAKFGKPTLCLIGPRGKRLEDLPKKLTVGIASKYRRIAKKYLNFLERRGFIFSKIYVSGCVEALIVQGVADLIIDIVYTGSSIARAELEIYDSIMQSDFLIITGKDDETKGDC